MARIGPNRAKEVQYFGQLPVFFGFILVQTGSRQGMNEGRIGKSTLTQHTK